MLNIQQLLDSSTDEEIVIPNGEYILEKPLTIENRERPVTIKGGGRVVLKGSKTVDCPWRQSASVYYADIETGLDIQALFVNDSPYIMCRYPNYNENEILGGHSEDAVSKERCAGWANPAGGYVRALHDAEWGGNSYIIRGKKSDGSLDLQWVGDNNRGSDYHKEYVMVENIFEELDAPKEWFYNSQTGRLHVIAEKGVDLNNCKVEYSVNSELVKIISSAGVTFENISFEKTNRTLFNSQYRKVTRSDWSIAEKGAVYITNSENIKITSCSFKYIGSNCIYFDGNNSNSVVSGCDFTNCGASGVIIFGKDKCLRDVSSWENHKTEIHDDAAGPCCDDYPKDITVENCYFYNLGIYEKQSAPVSISVASRVAVRGCTIHHMPRAGINVCDGSFGGHVFENNDIFDTVRESGDHGPFNAWGRDRFWSLIKKDGNGGYGKQRKPYALLDAVETVKIRHNRIVGHKGFGIDLDDGSTNYEITDNLCFGVGIKLREGFFRTVKNNLIINAPLDLHCTFEGNDDVIENNVVCCKKPVVFLIPHKGYTTVMKNNLFVNAESKTKKIKPVKQNKNYFQNIPEEKLAETDFSQFIGFEKISPEFGVSGKPKPDLKTVISGVSSRKVKIRFDLLSDVSESVRSMSALPDCKGAYVEKIGIFSPLAKLKIKKNDIIRSINGSEILNAQAAQQVIKSHKLNSAAVCRGIEEIKL